MTLGSKSRLRTWVAIAIGASAATWASSALADNGRLELNQATVDAAGGFPLTISAPGNYVLTGPLVVPASTDAFILQTNDVVFDLNGFSISGPATCDTSSCPAETGMAFRGWSGIAHARRVTVENGTVRGFGSNCVQLNILARVENLLVTDCGGVGISVSSGSVVTHNRVFNTGKEGILMSGTSHPPTYGFNTAGDTGLGGGGEHAIWGGRAGAGNSCQDGSCSSDGRRRYYVTKTGHAGDVALTACESGFHMAAISEVLDVSGLQYDVLRGDEDGVSSNFVWIRTQVPATPPGHAVIGESNCQNWSTQADESGTVLAWETNWSGPFNLQLPGTFWTASVITCEFDFPRVLCIED